MDLLELSDDELDYELGDIAEIDAGMITRELTKSDYKNQVLEVPNVHSELPTTTNEKSSTSQKKNISPINRKRKKVASLHDTEMFISDTELDGLHYEADTGEQESDDDEQLVGFTGRLAGRVKRIMDKDEQIGPIEGSIAVEGFASILEHGRNNRRNLKDDELEDVYNSLGINPDNSELRLNTLYVTGAVDKMNTYDISRIFAEFDPDNVRPLGSIAFTVTFANALDVAQVLLEMSKPLRRVRKAKRMEEGELMDSSEEDEGQVKEENGEDVAIIKEDCSNKKYISRHRAKCDVVEVDVESVKIPPGKWRVITAHVPDNKLIYVRIATGFELRCSVFAAREQQHNDIYNFRCAKIRPGLNVFDEKGNELDWDYEHDTRFFEGVESNNENGNNRQQMESSTTETLIAADGIKIRSRGRGAKKFMQALKDSDDDGD